MEIAEQYRLSQYQDFGKLDERKNIRLKRHKINGVICVEKRVPQELQVIYCFLKQHPSEYIPHIYECVTEDNELIVIEEYIAGRTLEDILKEKWFGAEEAASIIFQVCQALKPLHNANPQIICRDLKAENIMVDDCGKIKLVDFNIARTFQEGKNRDTVLLGTMEYAAPEQFGYFQTDNRTDIFSMGVLLNYLILKKFPVEQIICGPLENVVRKCINLNPIQRYQSVEEVEVDIIKVYEEYNWSNADIMKIAEKSSSAYSGQNIRKSYLPPGFRTRTPWKMIVAVCGYVFATWFCFSLELIKDDVPHKEIILRFEQSMIWIGHITFIGICCNYRNCADKLRWVRSDRFWKRVIGYVIAYIIIFVLAVCCCAIGEIIFL